MPYLRYSRDKRGYEHTYVLHGSRAGGRPRILYWFRTPPHVVVGRDALDEEATKAIEVSHQVLISIGQKCVEKDLSHHRVR